MKDSQRKAMWAKRNSFLIRPKMSYYDASSIRLKFPNALIKNRIYRAIVASNQPEYKEKGKVFVGNILLHKEDYEKVRRK